MMEASRAAAQTGPWVSLGPRGGGAIDLARDPFDHSLLYAGVSGRGVFRSVDSGATWLPPGEGLSVFSGFSSVEPDPLVAGRVWAGVNFAGVFVSEDRGGHWIPRNAGLPGIDVLDLLPDPSSRDVLYVATRSGGVFRSADSGLSWTSLSIPSNHATALAIDPQNPRRLWAGTTGLGIYRSTDAGATWQQSSTGTGLRMVTALRLDPASSSTLYAATEGDGLYRSMDGGVLWNRIDGSPVNPYVTAVAFDPSDSMRIYAATLADVFVSRDRGASWEPAHIRPLRYEAWDLLLDPAEPTRLFAATGAGVFTSDDGARTWMARNSGLSATLVMSVAFDPNRTSVLFAASYGTGVLGSEDGGVSWKLLDSELGSPLIKTILRLDGGTLLGGGPAPRPAFTTFPVFRSVDDGTRWTSASAGFSAHDLRMLVADSAAAATVYAATGDASVLKTTDGGSLWTPARSGLPDPVFALAADPTRAGGLWAAVYSDSIGGVYYSENGGAAWTARSAGITNRRARSIAAHPVRVGVVYVGTEGGGVFRTLDGGLTWSAANAGLTDLTVRALAVDPLAPEVVYAGTPTGVFVSAEAGASWTPFGGLPETASVLFLALDPAGRALFAGTAASGLFRRPLRENPPVPIDRMDPIRPRDRTAAPRALPPRP